MLIFCIIFVTVILNNVQMKTQKINIHENITTNKEINSKIPVITNEVKKQVNNGIFSGISKFGINFKVISNTIFLF